VGGGWWRITRFKDPRNHVLPGDKIVLWQVEGSHPDAAGVYAIGTITKQPELVEGLWRGWYRLTAVRDLDNPISAGVLRADPFLRKVPVFRKNGAQGTNFRISHDLWARILSYFEEKESTTAPEIRPTQQSGQGPDTALVSATAAHEIKLGERRLVRAYRNYMRRKGSHSRPYRIRLGRDNIECDLYDKPHRTLIEAKGAVSREAVRMAIGQLADYVRFFKPRPELAVLLPTRPRADLLKLLLSQKVHTIWQDRDGDFSDNSSDQRFTSTRKGERSK
jgi:hypothetical protein